MLGMLERCGQRRTITGLHTPITVTLSERRDLLPELRGDERNHGMGQSKNRLQHPKQRAPRCPLPRLIG